MHLQFSQSKPFLFTVPNMTNIGTKYSMVKSGSFK